MISLQRHDRYEQLKGIQEKHNFHIGKLETIMRMVDNDALPLDQVCCMYSQLRCTKGKTVFCIEISVFTALDKLVPSGYVRWLFIITSLSLAQVTSERKKFCLWKVGGFSPGS